MIFPLIGNERIKETVLNSIKENRLPHAIIIEGDSGTGRHTLAEFISMAAVCESEKTPCGKCHSCLLTKGKNHPDISITTLEDNKKNISVSQIRELREKAFIKSHSGSKKVMIIDYADTMNEQSQNALLKILEEPPGQVMFILIAENKSSLLGTIVSRCVVLTLSVPQRSEAVKYIHNLGEFRENDIENALDSTQNNIGRALSVLKNNDNDDYVVLACDYLEKMLLNDLWGMLDICESVQTNRLIAEKFIKSLKYCIVKKLTKSVNSVNAGLLNEFYNDICLLEKSLDTNINLNLLFCALNSKAEQIVNNR